MFVQVIRGQVTDRAATRAALERWVQDLSPGVQGWLGTTAGVTDDGQFLAVARFDSLEAARRNSDRAEQGEWWTQTATLFSGAATFHDSTDVELDIHGDLDRSGFVQVIQGRTNDPARVRELMSQNPEAWAAFRPDVLGSVSIGHDGGRYTMVLYFTSEAEAREGEGKEPPPEVQAQMAEMDKLEVGEPTFLDISEPWLYSPR